MRLLGGSLRSLNAPATLASQTLAWMPNGEGRNPVPSTGYFPDSHGAIRRSFRQQPANREIVTVPNEGSPHPKTRLRIGIITGQVDGKGRWEGGGRS